MMLIGTSFGGCLKSLLKKEVHMDDVLIIITRTAAKDIEGIMHIVEEYHRNGNYFATKQDNYDFNQYDLDEAKEISRSLYQNGKIHQPRLYNGFAGFVHVELSRNEIWIPLAPSPKTDDTNVVDAYNKFMMLSKLLQ